MVRHVLRAEREAGRLFVIGYGRGARWRRAREAESELSNGSSEQGNEQAPITYL
jgi:hypothetical protein